MKASLKNKLAGLLAFILPVACYAPPPTAMFQAVIAKKNAGGASPAWFDYIDQASTDTSAAIGSTEVLWCSITPTQSGSATKARIYISNYYGGGCTAGMALYTTGGSLISGANGTVAITAGSQYWEVTFGTPASVTASTTYYLAFEADNANADTRYLASAGSTSFGTSAWASFPPSSLPSDLGPLSRSYAVGLYVE